MAKNDSVDVGGDSYEYGDVDASTSPEVASSGDFRVRARSGNEFRSSNEDIPLITPEGVALTREQAEFVLHEDHRTGILFVEPANTEGEGS